MSFGDPESCAGWDTCIPSRFNHTGQIEVECDPWSSRLGVGRQANNLLPYKQHMLQKHVQEIQPF